MSDRYFYDEQVFSEELKSKCRSILKNNYAVISFRDPGDPLTSTEQRLGDRDLVEECRVALRLKGINKRRNVYFGGDGTRRARKNLKKEIGVYLINQGHSAQAVADALGVTRSTVARWVPSKRQRGAAGHSQVHADVNNSDVLSKGLERMCRTHEVAFVEDNLEQVVTSLSQVLWMPPDKLKRRAVCAGNAIADAEDGDIS